VFDEVRTVDNEAAFGCLENESVLAHGREMGSARDERDFVTCAGQQSAEMSTDGSCAHDRDSHA
jgi:hypothetical protein